MDAHSGKDKCQLPSCVAAKVVIALHTTIATMFFLIDWLSSCLQGQTLQPCNMIRVVTTFPVLARVN